MLTNQEKQDDEIFVLQNIYSAVEFKYSKKLCMECSFSIYCESTNKNLLIVCDSYYRNGVKKLYIKHLPPVRLYVQLPENYPSDAAPWYNLAINWLPPWEVSLICQKLDELWKENEFNEILFIWLNFLKNDLLNYLDLLNKNTLEVSYLFILFKNPFDRFLLEVLEWTDKRVIYGGLYLNPIERLLHFNKLGDTAEFEFKIQKCGICFEEYSGKVCMKVDTCSHVFCNNCILQLLTIKINERDVNIIKCPAFDCKINLKFNQIKNICTSNLFKKYEKHLLDFKLLNTKKLVYCPRRICQTSVILKNEDNLASCPNCKFNFCPYCFKVYHGVAACEMNSDEKLKLITEYQNGDISVKRILEKKYGKHQIHQIIEIELTKNYIKINTKICPICRILITKETGCNLINCSHCHTSFCWLCNMKIISEDPYNHFKFTMKGPCAGRLYEDVDESKGNFNEINGLEFENNLNLFDVHNFLIY